MCNSPWGAIRLETIVVNDFGFSPQVELIQKLIDDPSVTCTGVEEEVGGQTGFSPMGQEERCVFSRGMDTNVICKLNLF